MTAMEVEFLLRGLGNFPIWVILATLALWEIVKSDLVQIPVAVKQRTVTRKQQAGTATGNSQNLPIFSDQKPVQIMRRRLTDCGISNCGIHKPVRKNIQYRTKSFYQSSITTEVTVSHGFLWRFLSSVGIVTETARGHRVTRLAIDKVA